MCQSCYDEAGRPFVGETEEVIRVTRLVSDLYQVAPTGGLVHIVTDDDNVGRDYVLWCINNPHIDQYTSPEEFALGMSVGLSMADMTDDEVWTVLAICRGYEHG